MSSPGYKNGASQEPSLPTHIAALQNHAQTLEQLIKQGEELVDDSTGESPFHAAARGGSIDVILWLLENVTAITPRDKATNGHTPAHVAAVYGHMGALRAILEYNKKQGGLIAADQDRNGLTILHLAVLQGDDDMLRYILNNYPHLAFCSNENGDLPVHFAAAQGEEACFHTHSSPHIGTDQLVCSLQIKRYTHTFVCCMHQPLFQQIQQDMCTLSQDFVCKLLLSIRLYYIAH